jgi:membrane protease YdiL (CAAX protease family)
MFTSDPGNFNEDTALARRRYYALVIVGMALPFLTEAFLTLTVYQKGQSYFTSFAESRFIIWVSLGLLFFYSRYAEVQRFLLWDEEEHSLGFYLKWVILLFLLCYVAQVASHIPYWFGLHEKRTVSLKLDQMMKQYPAFGFFTAATAGITEELFFRGYVMGRLALFFRNKHYVVLISAALFCGVHLSYHYWGETIYTFLLGLIFGYHYYRYHNIKVLVIMHFIVDAIVVLVVMHYR